MSCVRACIYSARTRGGYFSGTRPYKLPHIHIQLAAPESSSSSPMELIKQQLLLLLHWQASGVATTSGPGWTSIVPGLLAIVCLSAAFLLLNAVHMWRSVFHPGPGLPPGPRGHFLWGTLFLMLPDTDAAVQRWSRAYGPVFTAWLGFLPTIFVTGSAEARELLVKHGAEFATRPRRRSRILLTNDHRNINTAPYGPRWRALRKNLVTGVLSGARMAACAPMRAMHVDRLVAKLRRHAEERPDEPVPVLDHVLFLVFSILLHVCFGQSFEEERVILFRESMKATLPLAGPNLGDFLPLVHMVINPGHYRRCKAVRAKVTAIMLPLIRQHRQRRRLRRPRTDGEEEDYVDSLLAAQERQELDLDDADLLLLCNELLNAGTDTSANTLEFAMAELVRMPELQARVADEIAGVCGPDRAVRDADVARLPLLRAVVLETLRLHPPGSYSLVHAAARDTTFRGFRVPRRAEILVSLKAVAMDPESWTQPERFRPERFLDGSGPGLDVDITGARGGKLSLIPFGAGRRVCPGINLAMLHLHVILGRLVQAFQWLPPAGHSDVDMTPVTVFTTRLRNPLRATIRPRQYCSVSTR